jgi:predicted NAD/FAD-binding protein
MNALQSIESSRPLLVTLNRHDQIDPGAVLGQFEFDHPVFDVDALRAQRRLAEIQGLDGTYYAGAYWGYGFHEDGVRSAYDVCRHLGVDG